MNVDVVIKNYFRDIVVGQTAKYDKHVIDEDMQAFVVVSRDYNTNHLDDDYAKNTLFGERIAHGILIANQILKALGYTFRGFS